MDLGLFVFRVFVFLFALVALSSFFLFCHS